MENNKIKAEKYLVTGMSCATFLVAGFAKNAVISLIVGIGMMVGMVFLLKKALPVPDSEALQKKSQKPAKE